MISLVVSDQKYGHGTLLIWRKSATIVVKLANTANALTYLWSKATVFTLHYSLGNFQELHTILSNLFSESLDKIQCKISG